MIIGCSSPYSKNESEDILTLASKSNNFWKIVEFVEPVYPYHALSRGYEGCVNISFIIKSDGKVSSLRFLKSSLGKVFDMAALKAVSKYRYAPTKNNVSNTPIRTNIIIPFLILENVENNPSHSREVENLCKIDSAI